MHTKFCEIPRQKSAAKNASDGIFQPVAFRPPGVPYFASEAPKLQTEAPNRCAVRLTAQFCLSEQHKASSNLMLLTLVKISLFFHFQVHFLPANMYRNGHSRILCVDSCRPLQIPR